MGRLLYYAFTRRTGDVDGVAVAYLVGGHVDAVVARHAAYKRVYTQSKRGMRARLIQSALVYLINIQTGRAELVRHCLWRRVSAYRVAITAVSLSCATSGR